MAILKPDVCIISTAIFVLLGGAQIWRPHSEPYKFLLHILKKNSAAENCTDVRPGQVVNLSIFYNIWNSWPQTFQGFDFTFRWRDSELCTNSPSSRAEAETKSIFKLIIKLSNPKTLKFYYWRSSNVWRPSFGWHQVWIYLMAWVTAWLCAHWHALRGAQDFKTFVTFISGIWQSQM